MSRTENKDGRYYMNTITSKTLKELRPALKEEGACKKEPAWCAKNPKAINLDSYNRTRDTLLADWMIRFLPLKRQEVVRFCKTINSILHYEQCKATPVNGTCDGVKKTTLYSVHKRCDRKVLKKHKQAQKDRKWLWAELAGLAAILLSALWWFLRPFWNNPGDGKDDDKGNKGWRKWRPAWQQAKANFKAARGFKAKMKALVNGTGQVYQAWRVPQPPAPATTVTNGLTTEGTPTTTTGTHPVDDGVPPELRETDRNVQIASHLVEETWPQTIDAFGNAQFRINNYLYGLNERDFPELRDDIDMALLSPLTHIPTEADIYDLRAYLFSSKDALEAFQNTVTVIQRHMLPVVTGQLVTQQGAIGRTTPPPDNLSFVDHGWEEVYRYLRAANELQTATGLLRDIIGSIGSVFSVDPDLNDEWRETINRARALLHDVDDIVSSYMSTFELGHVRDEETTIWTDIDTRIFSLHELSTVEGVMKTVGNLLRGRARENDVNFTIPEHFKHMAIPEDQRFALLLIAYSRAKDSIDFRCPDREGEDPFVQMWAKTDGDYATLHIIDNGQGMPLDLEEAQRRGTSLRYAFKLAENYGMAMDYRPRWVPILGEPSPGEDSKVSAGTEFQIRFRLDRLSDTPPGTLPLSGSTVGSGGGYGSTGPQNMAPPSASFAMSGMRLMGR